MEYYQKGSIIKFGTWQKCRTRYVLHLYLKHFSIRWIFKYRYKKM